ncbi:MAG: hemolysin family protein [Candidatus Saelkia tenebricola]|nr:hemolysin family protein [Candidatus Saelkia tenebricola]
MNVLLHYILLPLFLILSALYSSSESAIFSLTEYEKIELKHKNIKAWKRLRSFLIRPTDTISLIITGNTIANTVTASIVGALFYHFYPEFSIFISILIVTSVILFLGEIFPKLIALRFADKFSVFSTFFLSVSSGLISPLEKILTKTTKKLALFIDIDIRSLETKPALSELYAIVKAGEDKGILEKGERILVEKVLDFGKRWVKEIMTPRVEIISCSKNLSLAEIKDLIKKEKHTKFPVYEKTIDNIIGVLYARDLLLKHFSDWQELIHPLLAIPEQMKIDELLLQFRERNEEMSIIVDEYGGTAGIVTLEDILEELVGEIENEFRREKSRITVIDSSTYHISGNVSLNELSEVLNLRLKMGGYHL